MTPNRVAVLFALGLALAGGCGGRKPPPQPPTPPPAAAEVQVAISSQAVNADLGKGDLFRATLAGTWTARNLGSAQVYLQVTDGGNTFVLPEVQLAPAGGSFSYSLPLATTIGAGPRTGSLAIRACRDLACAQPYAGASASVAYQLRIAAVPEWETEQGNAAHDGYVPITLDPTRFETLWSWTATSAPPPVIRTIVTSADMVHAFLTQTYLGYSEAQQFLALDAATGAVRWEKFLGSIPVKFPPPFTYIGPLAIGHGRLYHQVLYDPGSWPCYGPGPEYCPDNGSEVRSLALADGEPIATSPWRPFGTTTTTPVAFGDFVYVQGAKSLRAYNRDGGVQWEAANVEPYAHAAPAVDEAHVYAVTSKSESLLSPGNLQMLDRATGALLASIAHPAVPGVSGDVAPVLGGRQNVIVHVDCLQDTRLPCRLASLDAGARTWTWTSTARYWAGPAVANGVIYARRDSPMVVDAIDEATGTVLWSRPLPAGTNIGGPLPNMIVTRNVLFVGTEAGTYAMELDTGRIAYDLPRSRVLAMSAGRVLYLARQDPWSSSAAESPFGLVAVRLQ